MFPPQAKRWVLGLLLVLAMSLLCWYVYNNSQSDYTGKFPRHLEDSPYLHHLSRSPSNTLTTTAVVELDIGKQGTTEQPTVSHRENLTFISQNKFHNASSHRKCVLTKQNSKSLKNFLFFMGYPRSGHSIVASFLDAHPHIIVAHEYSILNNLESWMPASRAQRTNLRLELFNNLSASSYWESQAGERSGEYTNKGYSLNTSSPWQGVCAGYLQVIGDKRAGGTCEAYLASPKDFTMAYQELRKLVDLPVKVIHVVRNPYDLMATSALYEAARLQNKPIDFATKIKERAKKQGYKYRNEKVLQTRISAIFRLAKAVTELTKLFGEENVLEIHNCDLVHSPKDFVKQLCEFTEVECPQDYIDTCAEKAFSSVSKSRGYVEWPKSIREQVELERQKYTFFDRYSFDGNC